MIGGLLKIYQLTAVKSRNWKTPTFRLQAFFLFVCFFGQGQPVCNQLTSLPIATGQGNAEGLHHVQPSGVWGAGAEISVVGGMLDLALVLCWLTWEVLSLC